ncbi:MAG: prepilin-type N-terminal cleavage/methylation domain-containing protein [Opitutaceae bacterium]|nr:prepilin-type N-terminal cleavage/methylation domain-containing protein [Opitutaceae bacterium]
MNTPFSRLRSVRPLSASGFTLIELLTVIAVIGILAGILIPVIGKVRLSGQNAVTVSNLRTLIQADLLHAADNRHMMLPNWPAGDISNETRGWWRSSQLLAYLGYTVGGDGWTPVDNGPVYGSHQRLNEGSNNAFPEVLRSGQPIQVKGWEWAKPGAFGIGMNMTCGTNLWGGAVAGQTDSASWYAWKVYHNQIKHPDRYIRYGEASEFGFFTYETRNSWTADTDAGGGNGGLAFRSGGKAAVAFASGAVAKLSREEVSPSTLAVQRMFKPLVD